MRRFLHHLGLTLLAFLRLGVAWIPTTLLAFWGFGYLSACVAAVLGPGGEFRFAYVANDGHEVVITGAGYSFDPTSQMIQINAAKLIRSGEPPRFFAKKIVVNLSRGNPKFEAWGVVGTIDRSSDGRFLVDQYAPKGDITVEPSLEIKIHDATITYRDHAQSRARVSTLLVSQVALSTTAGNTTGRATFALATDPGHPVKTAFAIDRIGRYRVESQLDHLALAQVVGLVYPSISSHSEPAQILAGTASGHLVVQGSGKGMPAVNGTLSLDSLEFRSVTPPLVGKITAQLTAYGSAVRTIGTITAPGATGTFDGLGDIAKSSWAGNVVGSLVSLKNIPLTWRSALPKDLLIQDARYQGWLRWNGGQLDTQGRFLAKQASLQQVKLQNLESDVALAQNKLTAQIQTVTSQGYKGRGSLVVDLKSLILKGHFRTMGPVTAQFRVPDGRVASATGTVQAIVTGTTVAPILAGEFDGRGKWDGRDYGHLQATVTGTPKSLVVKRAFLAGREGSATASGQINLATQSLNLDVQTASVSLAPFMASVSGRAYFKGVISGTFAEPLAKGKLEAYNIHTADYDVPEIAANLDASRHRLNVTNGQVRYAGGLATARGFVDLDRKVIAGNFAATGLLLDELVKQEVEGQVEVTDGTISGTLDKPRVAARISTGEILAFGYFVDRLTAFAVFDQGKFTIQDLLATSKSGDLSGTITYDPKADVGRSDLTAVNVPLDQFHSSNSALAISGTLNGHINATFDHTLIPNVTSSGTVQDLKLATMDLGAGDWKAEFSGNTLTASSLIGSVDRYLDLKSLTIDLKNKQVDLNAIIANVELKELLAGAKSSFLKLKPEDAKIWDRWTGDVNASVAIHGPWEAPDVELREFSTSKLAYGDQRLGKIRGELIHSNKVWNFDMGWVDPRFVMTTKGKVADDGPIQGEASLTNFDLSLLALAFPDNPAFKGKLTATAIASGTKDNPEVRGSLLLNGLGYRTLKGDLIELPLSVDIGDITYKDKVAVLSGDATYKGLSATLQATVPLNSLSDAPTEKFNAKLSLLRRNVQSVEEYVGFLDSKQSKASFLGEVGASGDRNLFSLHGFLKVEGEAAGTGAKLRFKNGFSSLDDTTAELTLADNTISLEAKGTTASGGTVSLSALNRSPTPYGQDFSLDRLLDQTSLTGLLSLKGVGLQATLPGAEKPSEATVDATVNVTGTPRSPQIGGQLDLSKASVYLPTEFSAGPNQAAFAIDPRFNGFLVTAGLNTTVYAPMGHVRLFGTGALNGTLSEPEFRAPLVVQDGVFQLPTRRVTLDSGLVTASYSGNPRVAHAELDLNAQTSATKKVAGDQYQTYLINLNIKGDLLSQSGLRLDGVSDPPDLSRDEILALIGEKSLLEGLGKSLTSQQDKGLLRDTLYQIAIPSLTSGLTDSLSQGLRLDYLTLDYNPFDQALIRGGKTIAKGLMIQATKQLSQPTFGRQKYEIKLTYQLPLRDRFLSRFRLGFGIDQDNPWKFSLDWSTRF